MGLDMYLSASKRVSGYEFRGAEAVREYAELVEKFDVGDVVEPETPSAEVSFVVAYWRKANQIHHWFVENCQGGVDECQKAYVSREQLEELRDLCQRVLDESQLAPDGTHPVTTLMPSGQVVEQQEPKRSPRNPDVAKELLPHQEGFFFGTYQYDEWYWEELENTIAQIDRALKLSGYWEFEYRSSW